MNQRPPPVDPLTFRMKPVVVAVRTVLLMLQARQVRWNEITHERASQPVQVPVT